MNDFPFFQVHFCQWVKTNKIECHTSCDYHSSRSNCKQLIFGSFRYTTIACLYWMLMCVHMPVVVCSVCYMCDAIIFNATFELRSIPTLLHETAIFGHFICVCVFFCQVTLAVCCSMHFVFLANERIKWNGNNCKWSASRMQRDEFSGCQHMWQFYRTRQ